MEMTWRQWNRVTGAAASSAVLPLDRALHFIVFVSDNFSGSAMRWGG